MYPKSSMIMKRKKSVIDQREAIWEMTEENVVAVKIYFACLIVITII